jgi:hypothetical protein
MAQFAASGRETVARRAASNPREWRGDRRYVRLSIVMVTTMNSDVVHVLVVVAALVAVVGVIYGALWAYEKKTGTWPGNGSTSSADSFSDITNSMD